MPDDKATNGAASAPQPQPELHIVEELEEVERPRGVLSLTGIAGIGLLLIAILVGVVWFYSSRGGGVKGQVEQVFAVAQGPETVAVTMKLNLENVGPRAVALRSINASLDTGQGEVAGSRVPPEKFAALFREYPDLREHSITAMSMTTSIPRAMQERGTVIFTFPVNYDVFQNRKAINVVVEPEGHEPMKITK